VGIEARAGSDSVVVIRSRTPGQGIGLLYDIDRLFNPLLHGPKSGRFMGMGLGDLPRDHRGSRRAACVVDSEHVPRGALFQFSLPRQIRSAIRGWLIRRARKSADVIGACREWSSGISSIPAILTQPGSENRPPSSFIDVARIGFWIVNLADAELRPGRLASLEGRYRQSKDPRARVVASGAEKKALTANSAKLASLPA